MITLEKQEVLDELDMIQRNYPNEDEYLDVLSDYIISVHEDANNPVKSPSNVADNSKVLLTVYDALSDIFGLNEDRQQAAIVITAFLSNKFHFKNKE